MPYLQGIKQRSRHAHMQATVRSLRDQQSARERESVRANAMHVSIRSTALLREGGDKERERAREGQRPLESQQFLVPLDIPLARQYNSRDGRVRSIAHNRSQSSHCVFSIFSSGVFRSYLFFFFGVFLLLWIYLYISVDDA